MLLRAPLNQLGVASVVLAAAIVASWIVVSVAHTGGLAAVIHNQTLVTYGGATAATIRDGEWWRLLTSQFVHVYFLHALLNAVAVAVVGSQLERAVGATTLVFVYVLAGSAGQLTAIAAAPLVVATGASQAAIGISVVAFLVLLSRPEEPRIALAAPAAYLVIQAALDLLFAGRIKPPHAVSFAVGAFVGAWWLSRSRRARRLVDGRVPTAQARPGTLGGQESQRR